MYARKAGPNRCRARHNTSYKVGWRDKATAASGVDDDCTRRDPHNRVATEDSVAQRSARTTFLNLMKPGVS
jgi:hypothetical protein